MVLQSYCTFCALGKCSDGENAYPDSSLVGEYRSPCGIYNATNVMSISYGGPEHNFPAAYQRRQCHEYVMSSGILPVCFLTAWAELLTRPPSRYMKLGLQGVSVLFASGDNGVAGHDGCLGPKKDIFSPTFPAKSVNTPR